MIAPLHSTFHLYFDFKKKKKTKKILKNLAAVFPYPSHKILFTTKFSKKRERKKIEKSEWKQF